MRTQTTHGGFSLIELMIAVAIIGFLAAIALPSYQDSVRKSKRAEGKAALLDLQNRMERYFIDKNSYANACVAGGSCTAADQVLASANTEHSYYTISISAKAQNSYTLLATPTFTDAKCGNLSVTNTGVKAETGTGSVTDCW